MKRRSFLKSASSVSLPIAFGGIKIAAIPRIPFMASVDGSDKVLILVRLDGGNDGLNTLIPLNQYDKLYNVRQNIIVPENSILEIGNDLGFHPSMSGFQNMFNEGKLNIIQNVAYPDQNRSHFRSADIWNSGSAANVFETTGWLGRYFYSRYPDFPDNYPNDDCSDPFAITMGSFVSQTCQGITGNYSTALIDPYNFTNIVAGEPGDVDLNSCYGIQLDFLRTSIDQTNAYASSISNAISLGDNQVSYPGDNNLAQQLKIVAKLISGGLGTSVYIVSQGGYDTHANQVDTSSTTGTHATLLQTLSDTIALFQQDLELLGVSERVIGMTYSEFGRRIRSNDSLGTDHGTAAPMFVFGSCANPVVIGNNFEIPDEVGVRDGVPMEFDFRSVYGSILMDWFGVTEEEVHAFLFDDFQHIPIIQACNQTNSTPDIEQHLQIETYNFPNPFENWTTIVFQSTGDTVRVGLYDMLGSKLKVITDQFFPKGVHQIKVDMSPYPSGNYSYRISTKTKQATRVITKT